jgi:hypothetical protein
MEWRYPLAEAASPMGLVHFVDPKLTLHLVDEIDKYVGFHNVNEVFYDWGVTPIVKI